MVLQANLLPRKRSCCSFKHSPGWPQEWKPFSTRPRDDLSLNAIQPPAHILTSALAVCPSPLVTFTHGGPGCGAVFRGRWAALPTQCPIWALAGAAQAPSSDCLVFETTLERLNVSLVLLLPQSSEQRSEKPIEALRFYFGCQRWSRRAVRRNPPAMR